MNINPETTNTVLDDDATQPRLKAVPRPAPMPVPESFQRLYLISPSITGEMMTVEERQRNPTNAYVIRRMGAVEAKTFVEWVKEIVVREHVQTLLDPKDLTGRFDVPRKWKVVNGLAEQGFAWTKYLYEDTDQAARVLNAWKDGKDAAPALQALEMERLAEQAKQIVRERKEAHKMMQAVQDEVLGGYGGAR